MREKKIGGRVVRDTTFNGGKQRKIFDYGGPQVLPARPSCKGRLKRRLSRSKVEKVEG
jgi:hypothetical protein